jgi:hypothetical protein
LIIICYNRKIDFAPSGTAVLRTPVLPLTVLVDDMFSLTPLGNELDGPNIDKELNDLLAE